MSKHQQGFTAVELLVTLFVAAAFLVAAYQLFNIVIKDGGQARAETKAGNVAYDYLRRYSPYATNPCTVLTPLSNSSITVDGLNNVKITVAITCPQFTTTGLSKVEATVTYNNAQTVKYSTFTDGSSAGTADVTDGLVAWWKFNGNANTSVGTVNGVVTGATLTTGQNGLASGAYAFNGTASQYISYNSTFGIGTGNFTFSAWVNPAVASDTGQFLKIGASAANGIGIGMGSSSFESAGSNLIVLYENVRWITNLSTTISTGWHHIVVTFDSSSVPTAYYDGTLKGSSPGAGAIAPTTTSVTSGQSGSTPTTRAFNGAIDDMRLYNRALSALEVSQLASNGAK